MARLPRLAVADATHYLLLRGLDGERSPCFADAGDRDAAWSTLVAAAAAEGLQLHAAALLPEALHLLVTTADAAGLARMVQSLGRRYVAAYNRRHGRRGPLWDGRYRCAVVEAGPWRLQALLLIDGLSADPGMSTASHHCGTSRWPGLRDLPEWWSLGNTPFEREAAYAEKLSHGPATATRAALLRAVASGWVFGSAAYAQRLAAIHGRPTGARPRGRPRRQLTTEASRQ